MNKILQITLVSVCMMGLLASCEDDPRGVYTTSDQLLISDYLANQENMTITTQLLKRVGRFNLLNSYGHYTVFAPTDEAWTNYFSSVSKSGIDALSDKECNELFDFHVLYNGVNLKAQLTGLLMASDTTMSGIQHYVDLTGGFSNIVMNKTSQVLSSHELPNGFLYRMSSVFVPRPDNIYDYLKQNGYTLFCQAADAVGMKDTLNAIKYRYLTDVGSIKYSKPYISLLAEPDAVFQREGITNIEQLKAFVLDKSSTVSDADEALRDFVRYHFLDIRASLDYFEVASTFIRSILNYVDAKRLVNSMYANENISTLARNRSTVIAIESSFAATPDPLLNGRVKFNLVKSDVSFKNGIVHELNGILYPENKAQPQEVTYEFENTYKEYIAPDGKSLIDFFDLKLDLTRVDYGYTSGTSYSSSFYASQKTGYAFIVLPTEKGAWAEFYIRNLPAGRYELYLNYRRIKNTTSQKVNVYFRKASEAYNWSTQLLRANLDMAHDDATSEQDKTLYREYGQNEKLGVTTRTTEENGIVDVVDTYGDYVIRFVHIDKKPAYYDNLILKPIN